MEQGVDFSGGGNRKRRRTGAVVVERESCKAERIFASERPSTGLAGSPIRGRRERERGGHLTVERKASTLSQSTSSLVW